MPRYPSGGDHCRYWDDKSIDWVHCAQVDCRIVNQTKYSWFWEDFRLQDWTTFVPGQNYRSDIKKEIRPGESTDLYLVSRSTLNGVEAWVTYNTDAGPLEFHWNVPLVGGNSYDTYKLPAEFISVHNSGHENTNNTTVNTENDNWGNRIDSRHPRFEWTIKQRAPEGSRYTDHFYTTDPNGEVAKDSGYTFEGIIGYVYPTQQPDSVPFYRFCHSVTGDHFYTQSSNAEGATGYVFEKIECYLPAAGDTRGDPIYRWFGNSEHFYTTDPKGEVAAASGYSLDGEAGLIFLKDVQYSVPLYRWRR